jgi:hypothetical protein
MGMARISPPCPAADMILGPYLDRLHDNVRQELKVPPEFVIHSLRHTMLTRRAQAGADAFTIMKIAGHSSVRCVKICAFQYPREWSELSRLEDFNAAKLRKPRLWGGQLQRTKFSRPRSPQNSSVSN